MSDYFVSVFICNFCGNYFFRFRLGRAAEMIGSEGKRKKKVRAICIISLEFGLEKKREKKRIRRELMKV